MLEKTVTLRDSFWLRNLRTKLGRKENVTATTVSI